MNTVSIDDAYKTVVVTEGAGEVTVITAPSPAVLVETAGLGPQGPGGVLGLYGNFIDTTDQPIAAVDVAQPLLLGTTLESRGITLSNQSRINFSLAGTYKILVSLQITNASNNLTEVDIFLKLNGSSIANSNTRIDLEPRKSVSVVYHDCFTVEFQLTVAPNDYLEVWWLAESLGISIDTIPSSTEHPQAPGAIVNVAQVMYAQTDSFRSITIASPQTGDNFTLFRTTRQTIITSAVGIVSGGSVTYALRYAEDRSTAGTLATVSDTVTNTTTGDAATVQNQPIAANRYVWVEITSVTGSVNEFNLSVAF